jgi:hypothetical protein
MGEPVIRMAQPDNPPTDAEMETWMGPKTHRYWKHVMQLIGQCYPNVFAPEWLFGGKKHGWSLRYKKGRSLCTLIPEKNRVKLLIVFGAEERAKVEAMKDRLSDPLPKEIRRRHNLSRWEMAASCSRHRQGRGGCHAAAGGKTETEV